MTEAEKKELERLRAAEKAAAEEKERRDKLARDQQQLDLLDRATGWFGGFWGFLAIIAVAFVAYAVIGPKKLGELWDKGTELLGNLADKFIAELPENWQNNLNALLGRDVSKALEGMEITEARKTLLEKKVPVEVVNILAKNKDTFVEFLNLARDANDPVGRKVKESEFTNDKTVFALLTRKPEMARELAAVALKADGAATSKAATEIKASILAIVKDGRLDVLLNPPHLDNTKALFGMMPGMTKEMLETVLKNEVIGGKATPALRDLITMVLTTGTTQGAASAQSAQQTFTQLTPETRKGLIDEEMKVKPTDDAETRALKTNNGGKALATLREKLGDDKFFQFGEINKGVDEIAKMKFALENRAAFEAFHKAADVSTLGPKTQEALTGLMSQPTAATAPLLAIIANGVDPRAIKAMFYTKSAEPGAKETLVSNPAAHLVTLLIKDPAARADLAKAKEDNVVALLKAYAGDAVPTALTPKNLSAILAATQAIGGHARMKDETTQRDTLRVVNQFVEMALSENPEALNKLTNKEIADFMKLPTNSDALKTLLAQTKDSLPKASADKMSALVAHWEIVSRLSGNEEGAAFLKSAMSWGKGSKEDVYSCLNPNSLGLGAKTFIRLNSYNLSGKTFVGEHADDVKKVLLALKAAECDNLPALPNNKPAAVATAR